MNDIPFVLAVMDRGFDLGSWVVLLGLPCLGLFLLTLFVWSMIRDVAEESAPKDSRKKG